MNRLRIAAVLPPALAVLQDLGDEILHRAVRGRIGSEVEAGGIVGEPRPRRERRPERQVAAERFEDMLNEGVQTSLLLLISGCVGIAGGVAVFLVLRIRLPV